MSEVKSNIVPFLLRRPVHPKPAVAVMPEMICPDCNSFMWPGDLRSAAVLGEIGFQERIMQCEACPYREPTLV